MNNDDKQLKIKYLFLVILFDKGVDDFISNSHKYLQINSTLPLGQTL